MIDKVIDVKLALADHRSSHITSQELARLGAETRVGGMLGGKPGLVVLHMGAAPRCMETLFQALKQADLPPRNFLPTHCCRTPELVADAVRFNQMGGTIDFTADLPDSEAGVAAVLCQAIRQGADPSRITMSSDAGGSQPSFNAKGECIGLGTTTSATLRQELRRMVCREGLPLETALKFVTENPAQVLGQMGKKGIIAPGADADLLVLDQNYEVRHLMAKGRLAVEDGVPFIKGNFEK